MSGLNDNGVPPRRVVFIDRLKYEVMLAHPMDFYNIESGEIAKPFKLPCGRCVGCQLDKSKMWAARIVCESFDATRPCWFVTLTYDDDHLKYGLVNYHVSYGLSTMAEMPTVCKQDISDFMTDLRMEFYNKYQETGIRFYGATEYGAHTSRPHAHIVIFNLDLRDLEVVGKSFCGDLYYRSPTLEKLWDKGFVSVAPFSYETGAYVARYCVKKQGQAAIKPRVGETIEREASVMSRRPGIGAEFAKSHFKEIYTDSPGLLSYDHHDLEGVKDYIQLPNGRRASPPRYFDTLYSKQSDVMAANMAIIKLAREDRARRSLLLKLAQSNYTEDDIMKIEADKQNLIASQLCRDLDRSR